MTSVEDCASEIGEVLDRLVEKDVEWSLHRESSTVAVVNKSKGPENGRGPRVLWSLDSWTAHVDLRAAGAPKAYLRRRTGRGCAIRAMLPITILCRQVEGGSRCRKAVPGSRRRTLMRDNEFYEIMSWRSSGIYDLENGDHGGN